MKNNPAIIAAVCFGIVVALHVGTVVAVRNFIDIPFVPIALAVIALLVTGFVFSFKALKRERNPRTYAVATAGVLYLAVLIFFIVRPVRFDKEGWNEKVRDYPIWRGGMLDDLMKNHLREGMTHGEVVELLGDSVGIWYFRNVGVGGNNPTKMIFSDYGSLPPDKDFCMAYDAPTLRGEEIYLPTSKILVIGFSKERTVGDFYLQRGQLVGQILKSGTNKPAVTRPATGIATATDTLRAYKLYNRAIDYNLQMRNEQALSLYDSALMILPREPEFLTNRGYTKYELHDIGGTLSDYEEALAIDSLSATALANLGVVYFDMEEYALALSYTLKSVEITGSEADHFNLAVCRYNVRDYRGALDDLITYSKGKHQHNALFALYLMGNCCEFLGDMEQARHCWALVDSAGGPGKKAELDDLHIGISGAFNDYKNNFVSRALRE